MQSIMPVKWQNIQHLCQLDGETMTHTVQVKVFPRYTSEIRYDVLYYVVQYMFIPGSHSSD